MDTQKIGKFLKELRKENNMTQEQLGERIGVTNKTVSRWETGNYLPPVECLNLLSDIYQISINEILAGERVAQKDFMEVAEENISEALSEIETKGKKVEKILSCMMILTSVLALSIIVILPKGMVTTDKVRNIIVIMLVCVMAFISNTLNILAMCLNKERNR